MPRVSLARQQVSDAGLVPVYTPASPDGHSVENSEGKIVLHVANDGLGDVIVTIWTGYSVGGLKLQDRQVPVAAGSSVFIGPFEAKVYNQPDTSQIWFDVSDPTDVQIAVLLIP